MKKKRAIMTMKMKMVMIMMMTRRVTSVPDNQLICIESEGAVGEDKKQTTKSFE
jgi:hypothetical protein